jgi:hypothetical protein
LRSGAADKRYSLGAFMSIVIQELGETDGQAVSARVRHCENEFTALIHGMKSKLIALLNQECLVELSFQRVAAWRELSEFEDEQSGIKQSNAIAGAVTIQGRVHNFIEVEPGAGVIDLYLRNGPEFLAIESDEIGGAVPSVGSALELTVYGLCFYPAGT